MDEIELLMLITSGENESIEFKRELNLNSAKSRAEFIKDIISLANSAQKAGYLVIGVNDDRSIVGTESLSEEKIQQIAYIYINPAVNIQIFHVSVNIIESRTVGVLEILATGRPHKVSKSIEHIQKDEVFVRRGSFVSKASPEEIISMHQFAKGVQLEIDHYVQKAEKHLKIGNLSDAIRSYSEALNLFPSADILVARGKAYESQVEVFYGKPVDVPWEEWENKTEKSHEFRFFALKDFSNALKLRPDKNIEREARLGRLRSWPFLAGQVYSEEEYNQDFEWLRNNTTGYELGEAIFTWVNSWDYPNLRFIPDGFGDIEGGEEMVQLLSEAIELGYDRPIVYYLRSFGHMASGNNGYALKDIKRAIEHALIREDEKIEFFCLHAEILVKLGKYVEAYKTLNIARKFNREDVKSHLVLSIYPLEDFLCLYGLLKQFSGDSLNEPELNVLTYLLLWYARNLQSANVNLDNDHIQYKSGLDFLMEKYPGVITPLRKLIHRKTWEAVERDVKRLQINFSIPTFKEQMNRSGPKYVINNGDIEE